MGYRPAHDTSQAEGLLSHVGSNISYRKISFCLDPVRRQDALCDHEYGFMASTSTALTTSIAIFWVSVLGLRDERTSISSLMMRGL